MDEALRRWAQTSELNYVRKRLILMKTELLQVRVSPKLKALLTQAAAGYGISVSEYVRMLVSESCGAGAEKGKTKK